MADNTGLWVSEGLVKLYRHVQVVTEITCDVE